MQGQCCCLTNSTDWESRKLRRPIETRRVPPSGASQLALCPALVPYRFLVLLMSKRQQQPASESELYLALLLSTLCRWSPPQHEDDVVDRTTSLVQGHGRHRGAVLVQTHQSWGALLLPLATSRASTAVMTLARHYAHSMMKSRLHSCACSAAEATRWGTSFLQ